MTMIRLIRLIMMVTMKMVTMLIILRKFGGLVFRADPGPLDSNVVYDDVDDND